MTLIFLEFLKSINTNHGDPKLVVGISWGGEERSYGPARLQYYFLFMEYVQILSYSSMEKKEFLSGKYKIKWRETHEIS